MTSMLPGASTSSALSTGRAWMRMICSSPLSCTLRHLRLNVKRIDAFRAPHARQQQRQDTRPRAEISTAVAAFRPHEARQQHGIHAEAETLLLLQDAQPHLLQFVHPFAGQDGQFSGAISVNRLVRQ